VRSLPCWRCGGAEELRSWNRRYSAVLRWMVERWRWRVSAARGLWDAGLEGDEVRWVCRCIGLAWRVARRRRA
jgi:hypothetical protein